MITHGFYFMKFIQEYQNVRLSGQIYFKTCELIELLSKTW